MFGVFRETLIQAFSTLDLRYEAEYSPVNPCAYAGGFKEAMIKSALP